MRRRRLRWVLLGLIVLGLGSVFYQLRSTLETQKEKEVDDSPLGGMLPHAVQWIQNFRRVEIKAGQKAWEVEADEAQYLEDDEEVVLRKPRATFYSKGEDPVTVEGDDGTLHFAGKDLQRVLLHDNVEIHVRGFVIRAENAQYDRGVEQIVANGPVSIVGEEIEIHGRDMVVFMKDSRFELRQNVRVTLLPKSASRDS